MPLRTLFVNTISYSISSDPVVLAEREQQITLGLKSLKNINTQRKMVDMILIDNTVDEIEDLPLSIRVELPTNCTVITNSSLNNYGKINKGAGILEMIRSIQSKLDEYDFYVHHEPRTFVNDPIMFDSFFDRPRNYFRTGSACDVNENSFWTGTFFTKTSDLKFFLDHADLQKLCEESISIEFHIKEFYDKHNIPYDETKTAGVIWHDRGAGVYRNV